MNAVWIALIAAAGLVFLAAVVAGGVVLFLRLRAREPININLRVVFRVYLLVVIVAGLIVFAQGASNLVQVGFASVGGKQFSYIPVHTQGPPVIYQRMGPSALELKDRAKLTDAELEELSIIQRERAQRQNELNGNTCPSAPRISSNTAGCPNPTSTCLIPPARWTEPMPQCDTSGVSAGGPTPACKPWPPFFPKTWPHTAGTASSGRSSAATWTSGPRPPNSTTPTACTRNA